MSDYCCYFLDGNDQVSAVESLLDHRDDSEAVDLAVKILVERRHHQAVEVWDGDRLVSTRRAGSGGTP
jgi:hypothetical protein